MSEQADMLESPLQQQLSHHLNHHSNNGNHMLLQQQQQQQQQQQHVVHEEIIQLTNVQENNEDDLNSINTDHVVDNTIVTTTEQELLVTAVTTTATMAALVTANAIAAAAVSSMNNRNNNNNNPSNNINNVNTTLNLPVSSSTLSHLHQANRRNNINLNTSNLISSNSISSNSGGVGTGNSDGNHLSIHRVIQKSRDCHHHQQQQQQQHHQHQNSSGHENEENVGGIVVGDVDVIIGEVSGNDEDNNVIIGHATSSGGNDDDEFQLQLHHHHNMLVHENEIEIGNVVEQETMQHHEEVIIGGTRHPIVIKTEVGEHDLSGTTVTLVSTDDLQQQQMHHITVGGRESANNGLNNGPSHDGSRGSGHQHQHHGNSNIITIPVVGSMPYTVISEPDQNLTGTRMSQDQFQPTQRGGSHQTNSRLTTTTHSATNPSQTSVATSSTFCNSHLTWEEAVSAPILPIRCKDTNAELYKNKFGSGNKGKCIKTGNEWFTPTEFEALCGRGNSKDWKRSIRFGGRTLQTLIDKGFLVPHASSCICSNCVDDATATGPIRPFTPYQRKRKSQSGEATKTTKLERLTSKDSNTDESSDIGTPGTPHIAGLNPLAQALMKVNQMSLPACTEDAWKVLEDGVDRIVTAAATLKSLVQEMKERTHQETEELRSQLQNSIQTVVQNPVVGHPQILRIFDSNRIQTYSIEVLDPESFKPMQANSSSITKCDNCGREGSLECSGCHAVHYCSSFCQKKDWPTHQAACQDRGTQLKEEVL